MLADLLYVLRALTRNRGFTLITVLTLALGIGSAAAIFSVTDWILFRANKFPDDVCLIGGQTDGTTTMSMRMDFQIHAYEEQKSVLAGVARAANQQGNIVVEGRPVGTMWMGVTANIFPLLGIQLSQGRWFLPEEQVEGADNVVVITHWFWRQHLGGRADALGRKIVVGKAVCTVVGILPEAQRFPGYLNAMLYRPLTYRIDPAQPWMPSFFVIAKLATGVSREQAQAALRATPVDVPPMLKEYLARDRVLLSSMAEFNQLGRPEVYWLMVGAVAFLYAIACLNASNLMLVRMLGLRREMSIRLALGGGRRRIIGLLAAESVTLAVLASLVGLVVANWFFPLLLSATGGPMGGERDWTAWTLGWRVVGLIGILTVLTSLIIAAIPALRVLRLDINGGLKEGGAALGESPTLARLRGALVILQATFAVILLAGAGLMIRTFANFQKIDLGFQSDRLAKVYLGLPPDFPAAKDWEACLLRLREIQAELARLSGVQGVGFGQDILLPGYYFTSHNLQGPEGREVRAQMAGFNIGYQKITGIRLKRGRWLDKQMGNEVMINESLARALFADQDPVGQFIRPKGGNPAAGSEWKGWEVAGVVGDIRGTLRDAPGNYIYSPEGWGVSNLTTFVLRLGGDQNAALNDQVKRRLYAFDPRIVVHQAITIEEYRGQLLWAERMANAVLKVLAGIALLLTVVGIYSVLAYTVDRRMGEFGVRMALGATRRDLVQLVMRRGVILTVVGILLGLGGALALTRYLKTLLFETSANDPWVLAGVAGLLLVTSVLACILPARRATKVDVSRLLRSE